MTELVITCCTNPPPPTRDFPEALSLTASYKSSLLSSPSPSSAESTYNAIYARMTRLVRSSLLAGVTHMRAHVESDAYVCQLGIEIARRVKNEWKGICEVEICCE